MAVDLARESGMTLLGFLRGRGSMCIRGRADRLTNLVSTTILQNYDRIDKINHLLTKCY